MQIKLTSVLQGDPADGGAAQLPRTVPECHAVIALLIERVRLLEERISLDSNNSSKPPSSNGPGSPNQDATPGQRVPSAARSLGTRVTAGP